MNESQPSPPKTTIEAIGQDTRTIKVAFQRDGGTKFSDAPLPGASRPETLLCSSGNFSGTGDYLKTSVDISAFEHWPDMTVDWRQDLQGRITDVRFTRGVARLTDPLAISAMNIDQALEKAINEVRSERERALSLALSLALDLPSQHCLAAAIQNKDRLACIKTPTAAWYYVDGRCVYGHCPMETLWTEIKFRQGPISVTVKERTLNPSDAPALQPPTPPAAPTPDPEAIYKMPTEGITHRLPGPEDADGEGVIQVLKDFLLVGLDREYVQGSRQAILLILTLDAHPRLEADPSVALRDKAIARVKDGRAYYDSADRALILAALEAMPAERAKQPPSC
jgi:hypothetical protein